MLRFSLKLEHKTCHSAIVVVLTHGTCGQLYGRDGKLVPIEEFISFLNASYCLALKNKPKLFIIQACRGGKLRLLTVYESSSFLPYAVMSWTLFKLFLGNFERISHKTARGKTLGILT